MTKLEQVKTGDTMALSSGFWNQIVTRVNFLNGIRGEGGVQVFRSDSNVVVSAPAAEGRRGTNGLNPGEFDPEIADFIHVGLNELNGAAIGPQRVRNWNGGGYQYVNELGRWGQFYPAGNNDFVWRLRLKVGFAYKLKKIELYPVFPNTVAGIPFWSTGQVWATKQWIYPGAHQPTSNANLGPSGEFNAYPLGVWKGGSMLGSGVRMNTDYSDFLSTDTIPGSVTKTFYFAGHREIDASLSHFFRVILFVEDADTGIEYRAIRGTISTQAVNPSTEN